MSEKERLHILKELIASDQISHPVRNLLNSGSQRLISGPLGKVLPATRSKSMLMSK